jgi:hypothetical protein
LPNLDDSSDDEQRDTAKYYNAIVHDLDPRVYIEVADINVKGAFKLCNVGILVCLATFAIIFTYAGGFSSHLMEGAFPWHKSTEKEDVYQTIYSPYTMRREGYSPLPYFGSESESLKYDILDEFDGVVEPHTVNYLYIYDENQIDASTIYYNYTICPTVQKDTSDSTSHDCLTSIYYSDTNQSGMQSIR